MHAIMRKEATDFYTNYIKIGIFNEYVLLNTLLIVEK